MRGEWVLSAATLLYRESNAIVLYLLEKYDKENKFGVTDEGDKYKLLQWLFFQASGQG